MKRAFILLPLLLLTIISTTTAQDIILPKPRTSGGMPLMEALCKRASSREFSSTDIDKQMLSNLLWAAWGYNRAEKRTAPSSRNLQELELYVVKKTGVYIYDARKNILKQISNLDVRKSTGNQEFVSVAPINIVFVADLSKGSDIETSHANCGFISQNIYLFCASEGLGTVVRAYFDKDEIRKVLYLKETQIPILAQTVGYKK